MLISFLKYHIHVHVYIVCTAVGVHGKYSIPEKSADAARLAASKCFFSSGSLLPLP